MFFIVFRSNVNCSLLSAGQMFRPKCYNLYMTRNVFALWTLIVVLIVISGFLVFDAFIFRGMARFSPDNNSYYAVYLQSGEIYFGKLERLSFFMGLTGPSVVLKNPHFLVRNPDGQNFQVNKFKDAIYGPENEIILNPEKVLWLSPLRADSPIMETLKNN